MKLQSLTPVLTVTARAFGIASLTALGVTATFNQPSHAQSTSFYCGTTSGNVPTTLARTPSGEREVIRWVSRYFSGSGYNPQTRCEEVSSRFQTNYTLSVSATAIPQTFLRDPSNTLNDALNLGPLSATNLSDFIGSVDRYDYYRFTLTTNRNFNLALTGLKDFTYVGLIFDRNGNGIVDSGEDLDEVSGDTNRNALISSPLEAGSYFIRVRTYYSYSNTNYTLSVAATTI